MEKRILFLACLLLWATYSLGQSSAKKFVLENTTKINSIDPNQDDYADLEVIGKAIGNSRVVMLGEQDHGDAPTFQAKARLIKYLHEKKGFNVVAFESDFYALHQGWQQLLNNKMSSASLMTNNTIIKSNLRLSEALSCTVEWRIPLRGGARGGFSK